MKTLLGSIALLCTNPAKWRHKCSNILITLKYIVLMKRCLLYEGIMQGDMHWW